MTIFRKVPLIFPTSEVKNTSAPPLTSGFLQLPREIRDYIYTLAYQPSNACILKPTWFHSRNIYLCPSLDNMLMNAVSRRALPLNCQYYYESGLVAPGHGLIFCSVGCCRIFMLKGGIAAVSEEADVRINAQDIQAQPDLSGPVALLPKMAQLDHFIKHVYERRGEMRDSTMEGSWYVLRSKAVTTRK